MIRHETLPEVELDEWEGGHSVLQTVDPDDSDTAELRSCYLNETGKFTNWPLMLYPDREMLDRTRRMVKNLGYVARTFDPTEIRELVDTLGEARLAEILGE